MSTETPALLKATAFFIVWAGCWLPIALPLAIALKWQPFKPVTVSQKLPLLASLYAIAPILLWGVTKIQGTFADYGLSWHPFLLVSLVLGFVLGVLGLAILFGLQQAMEWLQWRSSNSAASKNGNQPIGVTMLLTTLALGLWVSATEELIFRGFLLNVLREDYDAWLAAAIASLIFAVLHLVWEGRENLPQLPGLWLMGMVLTLARWVDGGSLGLAWGLHAGWIWAIATLDTAQLLVYTGRCPEWMTGLGGKPLAGGMGILFLLATAAVLWGLASAT